MSELPDSDTLYAHFLAPWIPDEEGRERFLRSDLEEIELEEGAHIRVLHPLPAEARGAVEEQLRRMQAAALADLPGLLGVQGDPSLEWLDALERWMSPERLRGLLRGSDPASPDNNWLLLCCETGALIALLLEAHWPALRWIPDAPYFESALFDLNAKLRIPVFHWAVKALSGEERRPLREKFHATIGFLRG